MAKGIKSIEPRHYDGRDAFFAGLGRMSRRGFLRLAGASAGLAMAKGRVPPHSFQLIEMAGAAETGKPPFTFAYISDAPLSRAPERSLRARHPEGGRRREQPRPPARLRPLRRRPRPARAARGARPGA